MSTIVHPNLKYQKTHEWARVDGNDVVVGITDHAQDSLSDLVYVELPAVGAKLSKGDVFGVVESVKAASDVYAPCGGTVVAVNNSLEKNPEAINKHPYTEGWLMKMRPDSLSDLDDLLDADAYEQYLRDEEH